MNRVQVGHCNVCQCEKKQAVATGYDFEYQTTREEFHYVQCPACGHIYLEDPPGPDALPVIYPPSYLPYNFHANLNPVVRWARNVLQRRKVAYYKKMLPPDAAILEVGAGSGLLIEALEDFGYRQWRLTANDFSGERLQRLTAKGVNLVIGNFEQLEFDEQFDCIIMNQTIEHFYNPDTVLQRCARLLAKRGILIIETPNHNALDRRLFANRYWGGYHIPRHFHVYSTESMTAHLSKHGLEVVSVDYLLSPSFWIQSLHHQLFDRSKRMYRLFTVNNVLLVAFFCAFDFVLALMGRTSNMRVIARLTA